MRSKRELWSLFFVFAMLCASVTWVRTATVRDTYRFVQQEREFTRLQDALQEARVRWLKASSPQRLETVAKDIGLTAPRISQRLKWPRVSR